MTSLRIAFLGLVIVATSAACGRSNRTGASAGGSAGTVGGTAGSGGDEGGSGGAAGTTVGDAGEAGTPNRGGAGGSAGSSGRGGAPGSGGSSTGGAAGEPGLSGAGGESGNGGITSVRDFNDAKWAAFCRGLFECTIGSNGVPALRAALGTGERCREVFGRSTPMNLGLVDVIDAVEDGRVVFAADQVAACLEATARCDHPVNSQPADVACRRVFQGTQGLGEVCARDEECAGGARCLIADACPGTCAPRATIGGDCVTDADCDDTNGIVTCDFGTSKCVASSVLSPVGEGEECWNFTTEELGPQPCAEGLWCDGDGIVAPDDYRRGTCRRSLIPVGDPCTDEEDLCADGAACRGDVCTVLTIRREAGAPCGEAAFCDPFERLQCVDGMCQSIGDGLEGSPCRFHDWSAHVSCEAGFVCVVTGPEDPVTSATARTCLPPLATGETCARSHECLSQTCGADGLCAASFCGNARAQF